MTITERLRKRRHEEIRRSAALRFGGNAVGPIGGNVTRTFPYPSEREHRFRIGPDWAKTVVSHSLSRKIFKSVPSIRY